MPSLLYFGIRPKTLADFTLPHMKCSQCGRKGRYKVARLIEIHGADIPIRDFIDMIDWPQLPSLDASDRAAELRSRLR